MRGHCPDAVYLTYIPGVTTPSFSPPRDSNLLPNLAREPTNNACTNRARTARSIRDRAVVHSLASKKAPGISQDRDRQVYTVVNRRGTVLSEIFVKFHADPSPVNPTVPFLRLSRVVSTRRSNSTPRFLLAGVRSKRNRACRWSEKNAATDIWEGERIFSVNEMHETTESIELR